MDFRTGSVGEGSSSYVYLPGRSSAMPGDFILAYDKPGNHGSDGVNVLCIDSSVMWIRKSELPGLMQKIADQEAQLPALRKKLKLGGGVPEPTKGPILQGPALPAPPKAPTAPEGW
ncbi:MAG TPA: hypothetical protein PK280_19540 [Planctomycetota bacterium]|nr:hypothetical protein [Planctomycetota bacterium]